MSDACPVAERREEILGELAEWMHAAAREAQRRLLEAETTDEFVKLTGSLAKLARGVRQSILAHRKLETERLAGEAAARAPAIDPEFAPRHVKRVRVRTAIARHVWSEFEDDEEAELFRDDLDARLDELEGADDFLDIPTDELIARLCRDLGFEPPAAMAAEGAPAAVRPAPRPGSAEAIAPARRVGGGVLAPDSS